MNCNLEYYDGIKEEEIFQFQGPVHGIGFNLHGTGRLVAQCMKSSPRSMEPAGLDPSTVEALIPSSFDEQSCTHHTRPLAHCLDKSTSPSDPARTSFT
jgi:hypothetical protein